MGLINKLGQVTKNSGRFLQKSVEDYIVFNPASRQVILKPKMVLFLCKKSVDKVEKLTNLEPDLQEGLIATVVHDKITAKIHFTPKRITLNGETIEGELLLLKNPEFETDSIIYRSLIASWKIFLGGYIPNDKLPESVKVQGNEIFYSLPKSQLTLVNLLFKSLDDGSALNLKVVQKELVATSEIAINWGDLNLQELIKMLGVVRLSNHDK
jgi:hypothetical protein